MRKVFSIISNYPRGFLSKGTDLLRKHRGIKRWWWRGFEKTTACHTKLFQSFFLARLRLLFFPGPSLSLGFVNGCTITFHDNLEGETRRKLDSRSSRPCEELTIFQRKRECE